MTDQINPDPKMRTQAGIVVVVVIILAFVLTTLAVVVWQVPKHFGKVERPGEFGDMFGVANALFSGLAFGGVIYTLFQQQQEIRRHRETLQMSADVGLFEYCNQKISSLRNAHEREKRNPNTKEVARLANDIKAFLKIHRQIRSGLAASRGIEFPGAVDLEEELSPRTGRH